VPAPDGHRRVVPRVPRLPLLLVAGWSALALAWAFSNPPFAAPDEGMHYLRAQGVEQGQLVGPKADPATIVVPTDQQREWMAQAAREVEIPARLIPLDAGCYVFERDTSAACIDDFEPSADPEPVVAVTLVGTYQPLPYMLPAAAIKTADSPEGALYVARIASAFLALALLALAAAAAWDARARGASLVGPVLAVTPMAIFCASILNGSSLEVAGGVAFIACVLRVSREEPPPAWVWVGAGISGFVLALSRSAAPVWIALAVLVLLALHGPRATSRAARDGGRAAAFAVLAVLAGVIGNRLWEAAYGPEVTISLAMGRAAVRTAFDQLPQWLEELVGRFGYLEFALPLPLYLGWALAVAAIVVAAGIGPRLRGRIVLAACVAGLVALPVAQYVLVQRHTGFGLQGRHALPVLVIVPLLAGELLRRHRDWISAQAMRALVVGSFAVAAIGHLLALYWNARRSATGVDGPLLFLGDAEWSPPVGWGLWLAVAAAGAACLLAAGVTAERGSNATNA